MNIYKATDTPLADDPTIGLEETTRDLPNSKDDFGPVNSNYLCFILTNFSSLIQEEEQLFDLKGHVRKLAVKKWQAAV